VSRLRILTLGALNGIFYSVIMLLLVLGGQEYEYARNIRDATGSGHLPVQLTSNERWLPMVVIWVVIFALAALVVDRFWTRKTSILFWETSGLLAVVAWNIFILSAFWLEQHFWAEATGYVRVTLPAILGLALVSLGVVLITSFLYAQAVSRFDKRTIKD
jgi:drug/metabolite transporter (DMT)-like permease